VSSNAATLFDGWDSSAIGFTSLLVRYFDRLQ